MEIIEVTPPNKINFKIPTCQNQKFSITNLTLRSICLYIVSTHPLFLSISSKTFILQAFQEEEIQVAIHWNQQLNVGLKSKIRIYIWELYDEEPLQEIIAKMFNKEDGGCCLMFEELTIQYNIDKNYLQTVMEEPRIYKYHIQKVHLPNYYLIEESEKMRDKLLQHCEKLGKVKAIYNFNSEYIVEFLGLQEHICSFFEIRDQNENLVLYQISQLLQTGMVTSVPDMIILDEVNPSSKSSFRDKISRKNKIVHQSNPSEEEKTTPISMITSRLGKNLIKQSFMATQSTIRKKRNRSEEKMRTYDEEQKTEFDYPVSYINVDSIKQNRNAIDYEYKIPKKKEFYETSIETTKVIFNTILSQDQSTVYVVLRDCLMICPLKNLSKKTVIQFDALDQDNKMFKTPTLQYQNDVIFANDCYIYWINVQKKTSEWKYVQRKQIYCLQIIDKLALLVVGGKNFSKLAYLGKSTSRTNLKLYSCGKNDKHSHLFTYDIPNCTSENILQLKYINTKPSNTKLLLVLSDHGKIFFLRIKAYNQIQVYSQILISQIGLQNILSLEYHEPSNTVVLLEELSPKIFCFKYLKLKCSYQKVEVSTESVKLPVSNYRTEFMLGERQNERWIVVIEKQNKNQIVWKLHKEEPLKLQESKSVKKCILAGENIIYQEKTSLKCFLLMGMQ